MKVFINIISAALLLFSFTLQAQSDKPIEVAIEVSGVCNMCKSRIESAALIKGVKYAEWDKVKQVLNVVYKPSKVSELAIHEAIANAGHDTNKSKAPVEVYNELPGCCAYRDDVKVH